MRFFTPFSGGFNLNPHFFYGRDQTLRPKLTEFICPSFVRLIPPFNQLQATHPIKQPLEVQRCHPLLLFATDPELDPDASEQASQGFMGWHKG